MILLYVLQVLASGANNRPSKVSAKLFSNRNAIGIQLSTGFRLESNCQLKIHCNPIGKWKPSIFQFQICLTVPAGTFFYKTKDSFQLEIGNPLESSNKLEIHWNPGANWNPIAWIPIGKWIGKNFSNWKLDSKCT